MIAGLALFLAGTVLCASAWSLAALIVGRLLQALGACAGIVLSRAIIRDVYDREMAARGLAIVMMAMTLAPAISPALGAYLAEWFDWRAIFVLLGALGALVFAATCVRLAETNRHPMPLDFAGMARSYALLLRAPGFGGFALCSACTSASWFTFIASGPYLVTDALGEPPSTYGLMILFPMAAYMLGNAAAARFALRVGSLRLLIAGRALALGGAGVVTLCYASGGFSVWTLFLPIAFAEIGDGLSQPSVMAAALSIHPRIAGTASGLMGFLQMTMAAVGSFAVALLPHDSPLGLIVVFSSFVAVALGSAIYAVRRVGRAERLVLPAVAAASDGS
jgi:DHA1 family bicyclomycin/chloramphenicol resistance-like MFS transporter